MSLLDNKSDTFFKIKILGLYEENIVEEVGCASEKGWQTDASKIRGAQHEWCPGNWATKALKAKPCTLQCK